jgi:hypothetical protein
MLWLEEGFAYADAYAEGERPYIGLRAGPDQRPTVTLDGGGLVVKADVAAKQLEADMQAQGGGEFAYPGRSGGGTATYDPSTPTVTPDKKKLTRFFGSKQVSADRLAVEASTIGQEVVSHLQGLMGADVEIKIDITVNVPDGVPDDVVRTVTENINALRFEGSSGFEEE